MSLHNYLLGFRQILEADILAQKRMLNNTVLQERKMILATFFLISGTSYPTSTSCHTYSHIVGEVQSDHSARKGALKM